MRAVFARKSDPARRKTSSQPMRQQDFLHQDNRSTIKKMP